MQILRFDSANFQANENGVTLQHLALINGKTTPTDGDPDRARAVLAGLQRRRGRRALHARRQPHRHRLRSSTNNQAAPLGPDTGGGAIYMLGSKHGVRDRRQHVHATTAPATRGAVGCLFAELDVYNSLFTDNTAIGHDANNDDAEPSARVMNNGQNEIGSGGNGGALYSDGDVGQRHSCAATRSSNNAAGANAFGGGLFFTSNDFGGDAHHRRHHDDRQHRRSLDQVSRAASPTPAPPSAPTPRASRSPTRRSRAFRSRRAVCGRWPVVGGTR